MNTDSLEAELVEAYKDIESSQQITETLGSELQKVAQLVSNLPAAIQGPRLVLSLGRMICAVPVADGCKVGREGDRLDLALPNPAMSRSHFEIYVEEERFLLRDNVSRNGTLHNGRRVGLDVELEDGDIIEAGGHHFVFLHDGQPGDPGYNEATKKPTPGSISTP